MANEKLKQNYKDIANSIRAKTGKNGTIKADEMATEIDSIETGIVPSGSLDITANGNNIDVTTKATVNVNVPNPSTGTKNITTNGDHDVTAFATAHVAVPNPSTGTLNITENNTYDVTQYAQVDVDVQGSGPQLQANYIYTTDEDGQIQTDCAGSKETDYLYWIYNQSPEYPLCSQSLPYESQSKLFRLILNEYEAIEEFSFSDSKYWEYVGGCSILQSLSGINEESDNPTLYVKANGGFYGQDDYGNYTEFIEGESPVKLIYYDAGSDLLFSESVELETGEEMTASFSNGSSYKITRIS